MSKRLGIILLVLINCLAAALPADEPAGQNTENRPYLFSVCALFKNEEKFLKEWIEYHKLIGVDHFYLYNNGSNDRSLSVLAPYIRGGLVTLIQWPDVCKDNVALWALSTQLPAYENAAKFRAAKDTKWLVFLDVDEFLVPVQGQTISKILEKYEDFPGVVITSDFFDASKDNHLPKRKLLIETVELTGEPVKVLQKSIEKTIFRPDGYTSFTWPPYKFIFKENRVAAKFQKNELRINKYVCRDTGVLRFGKNKDKLHIDNRMITDEETRTLLDSGFEIEDQDRAISRFVPQLLKTMGLDTGWNW